MAADRVASICVDEGASRDLSENDAAVERGVKAGGEGQGGVPFIVTHFQAYSIQSQASIELPSRSKARVS